MSRYDGEWPRYVPVAERRKQAERETAKLRKKGHPVAPVVIAGRAIATTFWGKAWCENLESYRDYESRLPRGRTYVRNGSVVDLQIAPLSVTAMVSGSSIYKVAISVAAAPKADWRAICQDSAGGINSLVELLQGRISKGVMERLCRQDVGLFPKPSAIKFSCTCEDHASMCKHIAAVLYGIGARLDEKPELLFRLRAVDEQDLLANLSADVPLSMAGPAADKILGDDDISALFGLDMADDEGSLAPPKEGRGHPKPVAPRTDEPSGATSAVSGKKSRSRKPLTVLDPAKITTSQPLPASETPTRPSAKSAGRSPAVPPSGAQGPTKAAVRASSVPKPALEVTADGFVKWWK
jgi:uncharacterized Zn finger protein